VLRLALVYALLDGRSEVDAAHLRAALAVWQYSEASVAHVWGVNFGNAHLDKLWNHLRSAGPKGLTRDEINTLFSKNGSAASGLGMNDDPAVLLDLSSTQRPDLRHPAVADDLSTLTDALAHLGQEARRDDAFGAEWGCWADWYWRMDVTAMPAWPATARAFVEDVAAELSDADDLLDVIAAVGSRHRDALALYRTIGRLLDRQKRQGWTAEEVDRLVMDLRAAFPDMTSLSAANLDRMRRFAATWPDPAVGPPVEQLPWGHIRVLLDQVDDPRARDWYAAAAGHGWSEHVLLNQIMARAHLASPATT
jgi:hypothetical protein